MQNTHPLLRMEHHCFMVEFAKPRTEKWLRFFLAMYKLDFIGQFVIYDSNMFKEQ